MEIRAHVAAVLLEEVKRQRRRRAEVARTAGLNKNALYRLGEGATLTVDSLWSLAEALDVSMEEFVARVSLHQAAFGEYRRRHGLTKGTAMKSMDLGSADFDHSIEEGDPVTCRTAHGTFVNRVAITRVQAGRDFPVVRVSADEFGLDDGGTDGIPWPAEAVRRGWTPKKDSSDD